MFSSIFLFYICCVSANGVDPEATRISSGATEAGGETKNGEGDLRERKALTDQE